MCATDIPRRAHPVINASRIDQHLLHAPQGSVATAQDIGTRWRLTFAGGKAEGKQMAVRGSHSARPSCTRSGAVLVISVPRIDRRPVRRRRRQAHPFRRRRLRIQARRRVHLLRRSRAARNVLG